MRDVKTNVDDPYFLNFIVNTVQGRFVETGEAVDLEYIVSDVNATPEEIEIVKDLALEAYYGLKKEYQAETEFKEAIKGQKGLVKLVKYGIVPTGSFLLGCMLTENLLGGIMSTYIATLYTALAERRSRSVSALLAGVKGRRPGELYDRYSSMRNTITKFQRLYAERERQEAGILAQESQAE